MSKAKEQNSSAVSFPMILLLLIAIAILGVGIFMLVTQGSEKKNANANPVISMKVGESRTLESVIGSDFDVLIHDDVIASVDDAHLLTALSVGDTYITATKDGQTQTFTLKVSANGDVTQIQAVTTVATTEPPIETTTEATTFTTHEGCVTEIKLTFYSVTLKVGEKKMPIVTMYPREAKNQKEDWTSSDESVATVDWLGNITAVGGGTCTIRVTSVDNPNVYAEVKVTVPGNAKTTASATTTTTTTTIANNNATASTGSGKLEIRDGITYVDGILIANKSYALPDSYNPGLTKETSAAFDKMKAAAAKDGLTLKIKSGFRSYTLQAELYNAYVQRDGKDAADTYSARPGHSEHQTGLAIDVNKADDSFAGTPEAKWLAENCWKYGFIIRYPEGKENITGYKYEAWHIRYLGEATAKAVFESGKTLEEYLGITSVYAS